MYFKSAVFTIVLFAIICVINAHPHRRHHRPRPLLPPEPYPGLPGNIPSVGYGAGGGGGGSFNTGPFRVGFGSGFGSGFGAGPNGMGSGFGAGSGYSVNGPGINLSHGQGFGAGSGSSG